MIRRPPRSTLSSSSAASDVYKRQILLPSKEYHEPAFSTNFASTAQSRTSPSLELPKPYIISNSACLKGGATLFFPILPLGIPPIPVAISRLTEPVEIESMFSLEPSSPSFIMAPCPNCLCIWSSAASKALSLSSLLIPIPYPPCKCEHLFFFFHNTLILSSGQELFKYFKCKYMVINIIISICLFVK